MDDHLVINLRVADMRYPLRIKRKEEEVYRRAANEIDFKIGQYKNYFAGTDSNSSLRELDFAVMTAVQAVAEKVEVELELLNFNQKLEELVGELDDYLAGE